MSVSSSTGDQTALDYPFPNPSALEPSPEWARLRGECPVARIRLASGDEAVLLTRHEDVRRVIYDPRFARQLDVEGAAKISDDEEGGLFGAANSIASGAGHQRWRRLVGRYFTARRMLAMRPRIEAMAEQLLDRMIENGSPADLAEAYGFPLPVWVIGMLLGIPEEDRHRFRHWSDTMLNVSRFTQDEINSAQADYFGYLTAHVAALRENPGEDLLSTLVTAPEDGERLSEAEVVLTAQGLLIAGHEATSNMIGKLFAMLLSERDRWEQLLADPAKIRTAIEEALRFDVNPGIGIPRYVSEDVELTDRVLPAGTTVICSMGAANRDGEVFPGADVMDLGRSPNPHVAFGGGQYSCLGQSLARIEMEISLELFLRRLPQLELAGPAEELKAHEGLLVGGLESVRIRW